MGRQPQVPDRRPDEADKAGVADTGTVLATDLVGSTELFSSLGEERAEKVRRQHDDVLAEAVVADGGRVIKGLGDGVLAVFGAATSALGAAVAIQQRIDVLGRHLGVEMAVRVGVSAGDVVHEAGDVFGMPVVEAARLCDAADGGQILVADVVRVLARGRGGFELSPVGDLELKGLPEPVPAFVVAWSPRTEETGSGAPPLPGALAGEDGVFVGHRSELEMLTHHWEHARTGHLQVALVSGEPGIGKTRLAAELARTAHQGGATVLYGTCSQDLDVAYEPFVEALQQLVLEVDPALLPDVLGQYPEELTRVVPELSQLVDGLREPLRSDPETQRLRLYTAVASCLAAAAAEGGLLLVLDDLHWSDAASRSLLRHLVRSASSVPLLVVGVYRRTDVDAGHPLTTVLGEIGRGAELVRVEPQGLAVADIIELMRLAVEEAELDERAGALATAVWDQTRGNPLFVVEVLRHLAESGVVYPDATGRWTTDVAEVGELPIPQSIREVVRGRVSRLSQMARRVLGWAAIVGQTFALELLAELADVPVEAALDALDDAVAAGLLSEAAAGHYRFSHALVRGTLYEQLSATRRAHRHLALARELETHQAPAGDLAYHYAQAGDATSLSHAVDHGLTAGESALRALAPDQAITHFTAALTLLDQLGQSDTRRWARAVVGMGTAQRDLGDPDYRQTLLDAAATAGQLGEADLLVAAALANHRGLWSALGEVDIDRVATLRAALDALPEGREAVRARLLAILATELYFDPTNDERDRLLEEAGRIARRLDDPELLADVLYEMTVGARDPRVAPTLHEFAAEFVEVAGEVGDPLRLAYAHGALAVHLITVGSTDQARVCLQQAFSHAAEVQHEPVQFLLSAYGVALNLVKGDVDDAEQGAMALFEQGLHSGQPDAVQWVTSQLFVVRWLQGRLHELVEPVEQMAQETPGLSTSTILSFVLLQAGERDRARATFVAVVDDIGRLPFDFLWHSTVVVLCHVARRLDEPGYADTLYRLLQPYAGQVVNAGAAVVGTTDAALGIAAAAAGHPDKADAHFAAAEAFEDAAGMRAWLMLTHLEWARALLDRGRDDDISRASRLLACARATAEEVDNRTVMAAVDDLAGVTHREGG